MRRRAATALKFGTPRWDTNRTGRKSKALSPWRPAGAIPLQGLKKPNRPAEKPKYSRTRAEGNPQETRNRRHRHHGAGEGEVRGAMLGWAVRHVDGALAPPALDRAQTCTTALTAGALMREPRTRSSILGHLFDGFIDLVRTPDIPRENR